MSNRIPAAVTKLLSNGRSKSNVEVIVDHLISEFGTVPLNEVQEALLNRLRKVDDLFNSGRYTSKEIAQIHAKHFGQSVSQSRRDMEDSDFVFGSTRKSNKKNSMWRHKARIEDAIVEYTRLGLHDLVPKLYDCLTKAIIAMPDDKEEARQTAGIIMNITQTNFTMIAGEKAITEHDAQRIASERLAARGLTMDLDDDDYTEVE
jgi:hypothetical protein